MEDQGVIEEVFVQDDFGIEIDFFLLQSGHIVISEVARLKAHGEAHLVLEWAEHAILGRKLDAAKAIEVAVVESIHAAQVEVVLFDGDADLEFVGDAVFDLCIEVPPAIDPGILAGAQSDKLIGVGVPRGQGLGTANPAKEMFVGLEARSREEGKCEERKEEFFHSAATLL